MNEPEIFEYVDREFIKDRDRIIRIPSKDLKPVLDRLRGYDKHLRAAPPETKPPCGVQPRNPNYFKKHLTEVLTPHIGADKAHELVQAFSDYLSDTFVRYVV